MAFFNTPQRSVCIDTACQERRIANPAQFLSEVSVAVRRLQTVVLRDPIMPVADGFFGRDHFSIGQKLHAKDMEGDALERQDRLVKLVAFVAKVGDDSTGDLVAVKLVRSSSRLIQWLTS